MTSNKVVPNREPLTEEQFRDNWLVALARLCKTHGDPKVALWLGVSIRHLRNLKAGNSLPTPDKIWNLLSFDPSAHDELDGAYGARNVPEDCEYSNDPLTLDIIAVAHEVAEHESPESHGGVDTTDHELRLKDEPRLRKVYHKLGDWLNRIDAMRGCKKAEKLQAVA